MSEIRIDKWLWAVRLYKTRSQATEACKKDKIRIDEEPVKASRNVKEGDIIDISKDGLNLQVQVKALLKNRVGAKLVENYMIDLTPQEEYDRLVVLKSKSFEYRQRGFGRPTKRDRREIDRLKNSED